MGRLPLSPLPIYTSLCLLLLHIVLRLITRHNSHPFFSQLMQSVPTFFRRESHVHRAVWWRVRLRCLRLHSLISLCSRRIFQNVSFRAWRAGSAIWHHLTTVTFWLLFQTRAMRKHRCVHGQYAAEEKSSHKGLPPDWETMWKQWNQIAIVSWCAADGANTDWVVFT